MTYEELKKLPVGTIVKYLLVMDKKILVNGVIKYGKHMTITKTHLITYKIGKYITWPTDSWFNDFSITYLTYDNKQRLKFITL